MLVAFVTLYGVAALSLALAHALARQIAREARPVAAGVTARAWANPARPN
ncbi:hypothetical protein NK718_20065 [Alsobacter sp. SYSU M60028]|uniref:Uncharacterized protein n=1 Tax=Alsobacter ponti TaxID=2962936 RepID=A0ABT1LI71_9HYPH|nr:hypothetical protein [Alsobacter ponti]MCP8940828.1 hypothetical protein [Alsobacter ponti]